MERLRTLLGELSLSSLGELRSRATRSSSSRGGGGSSFLSRIGSPTESVGSDRRLNEAENVTSEKIGGEAENAAAEFCQIMTEAKNMLGSEKDAFKAVACREEFDERGRKLFDRDTMGVKASEIAANLLKTKGSGGYHVEALCTSALAMLAIMLIGELAAFSLLFFGLDNDADPEEGEGPPARRLCAAGAGCPVETYNLWRNDETFTPVQRTLICYHTAPCGCPISLLSAACASANALVFCSAGTIFCLLQKLCFEWRNKLVCACCRPLANHLGDISEQESPAGKIIEAGFRCEQAIHRISYWPLTGYLQYIRDKIVDDNLLEEYEIEWLCWPRED